MENRKNRIHHSDSFIRKQKAKQRAFLAEFRRSSLQGKSCEAVGVSQDTIAIWRENDPEFEREYMKAELRLLPKLHDALVDRVLNGVEEGIYVKGDKVATERKFSDKLLLAAIAARDSRYRNTLGDQSVSSFQPASISIHVHPDKPAVPSNNPPK